MVAVRLREVSYQSPVISQETPTVEIGMDAPMDKSIGKGTPNPINRVVSGTTAGEWGFQPNSLGLESSWPMDLSVWVSLVLTDD